jgi:hypothetical protein
MTTCCSVRCSVEGLFGSRCCCCSVNDAAHDVPLDLLVLLQASYFLGCRTWWWAGRAWGGGHIKMCLSVVWRSVVDYPGLVGVLAKQALSYDASGLYLLWITMPLSAPCSS